MVIGASGLLVGGIAGFSAREFADLETVKLGWPYLRDHFLGLEEDLVTRIGTTFWTDTGRPATAEAILRELPLSWRYRWTEQGLLIGPFAITENVVSRLRQLISDEYAQRRIFVLENWYFSVTEAHLCAACSLLAKN